MLSLFVLTGFVARSYHAMQKRLAEEWYRRGESDLQAGRVESALEDFRDALVYFPGEANYQFRLAQALAAAGRDAEARSYLVALLGKAPSSGPVNLELARLAAREGSEGNALRYYHAAIFGVWEQDAEAQRLNTRLELCQFLLARKDNENAEAEVIALAANTPPGNDRWRREVGGLFLDLGDFRGAFNEFRLAFAENPNSAGAARGAGWAAYQLGNFREAERYLARAHRAKPEDSEVGNMLAISRLVLALDPFAVGLPREEQIRRARHDLERALSRLEDCARVKGESLNARSSKTDLQKIYIRAVELRRRVEGPAMVRHPEQIAAVMDLVFEIEQLCAENCGPPEGDDLALSLIGKGRQGNEK